MQADQLYLSIRTLYGTLFAMIFTVSMIYQVEVAGLTPLELVLVGTALEFSVFLFEVPTGVVADTWSRKWSIIAGFLITGAGFTLGGLIPTFAAIAAGSALWGFGWTFLSGTQEAWLTDEVGPTRASGLILKGARLSHLGSFVGVGLGIVIGSYQINIPYALGGVLLGLMGLALIGLMTESFEPEMGPTDSRPNPLRTFKKGLRVVKSNPTIILILLAGVVIGAFSEGYDRLSTALLLREFEFPIVYELQPVVWLGLIYALGNLIAVFTIQFVETYLHTASAQSISRWLMVLNALTALFVISFAAATSFLAAIILYTFIAPIRSTMEPITTAWLNQQIDSPQRATILSMEGQADSFGQMAGGPGVGLIGEFGSTRLAIFISGLLLLPVLWIYQHAGRKR